MRKNITLATLGIKMKKQMYFYKEMIKDMFAN